MDVESLLEELYALERFGIKLGLDVIRELLGRIGNPQDSFPTIHVTGTNGKGSTCAFLSSIFHAAGYRIGLYTSPHLVKFNERIRVDGRMISDDDVARLYGEVRPHARAMAAASETNQPTFFEVTTAMAFRHFEQSRVDLAVIEVGMGGRLDATNVISPEASVITRIGLEHTEHLGRSIERIAREKSGIIKRGVPVVTVDQPSLEIIAAKAKELDCSLTVVGRDVRCSRTSSSLDGQAIRLEDGAALDARIALLGSFQLENAALAYGATMAMMKKWKVTTSAVMRGLSTAKWPGRLQIVQREPTVIVDGAHNPAAAMALAGSLQELFPAKKFAFVLGILDDKDLAGIAKALGPLASRVIAAKPHTPRAFDPEDLAKAFREYAPVVEVPEVREALTKAVGSARPDEVVVVTGSIYTIGEALELLGGWE